MALRGNPIGHLYPGLTAEALPTPKLLTMAHHDVHVSAGYGGITDKRNRQVGRDMHGTYRAEKKSWCVVA